MLDSLGEEPGGLDLPFESLPLEIGDCQPGGLPR